MWSTAGAKAGHASPWEQHKSVHVCPNPALEVCQLQSTTWQMLTRMQQCYTSDKGKVRVLDNLLGIAVRTQVFHFLPQFLQEAPEAFSATTNKMGPFSNCVSAGG